MVFDAERALLEAVEQSDVRPFQKLRIRMALRFRPIMREEILGMVHMHCVLAGLVEESGEVMAAVDWAAIIEAIIKYLPAIISLISMFI